MSKKAKVRQVANTRHTDSVAADVLPAGASWLPVWLSGFWVQAVVVGLLALVLYANTFQHELALDDYMVITKNEYVYEGVAGLPDIFTKDAYDSYWKRLNTTNQLTGGRYRPLSIATFAIEQQFAGAVPKANIDTFMTHTDWGEIQEKHDAKFFSLMHARHVVNVILYVLATIVLLYFLRTVVFQRSPVAALLAALLFAIHPIHTEVVANVKSRDEIMSLLFILLTFIYAFRYERERKKWMLYLGLASYFLAFLSKEYAISLAVLLPLSMHFFNRYSLSKSITACLPYFGVALLYVIIRSQIVSSAGEVASNSIINDPYLLASDIEKMATKVATPINYLKLLIFPHPLSADYSYNSIPYVDFGSLLVWLSLVVHIGLIAGFFYFLKRDRVMSFAIAFYMLNLLLVCNLFFNIGGTMGERLIFHSSVGFCIAAGYLLCKGAMLLKPEATGKVVLTAAVLVLIALCAYKTITRNADWKNDETLFTHDIEVVPNSALVNSNVAGYLLSKSDRAKDERSKTQDLHRAIELFNKALSLDRASATNYFNKALAYTKLKEPDSVVACVKALSEVYPNYPQMPMLYYQAGQLFFEQKRYDRAKPVFEFILKIYPNSPEVQRDLKAVNDAMAAP